jgi:hypothetical protein
MSGGKSYSSIYTYILNSLDSPDATTPNNCRFNMNGQVPMTTGSSWRCYIERIQLQNLAVPTSSSYNTLWFKENGGSTVCVANISVGFYASGALYAAAVQTAMNSATNVTNTYAVSFNANTYVLTITANSTNTFVLVTPGSTALYQMGFTGQSNLAAANSLTGSSTVNIAGTNIVYFQFSFATNTILSSASITNIPHMLLLNVPYGSTCFFENHSPAPFLIPGSNNMNSIRVQLFDQNGNPFTMNAGSSWAAQLRLEAA